MKRSVPALICPNIEATQKYPEAAMMASLVLLTVALATVSPAQTRAEMETRPQSMVQARLKDVNLDKPVYIKDGALICAEQQYVRVGNSGNKQWRANVLGAHRCIIAGGGYRVQVLMPRGGEATAVSALFGTIEVILPPPPSRDGVARVTDTAWVRVEDLSNDQQAAAKPPVPQDDDQRRIGGGLSAPQLIYSAEPEFSEEGRKAKFAGNVLVSVWVETNGLPSHIQVIRPVGMGLDEEAVEAVRKYRFKPAMENGKPIVAKLNIEVNFQAF